MIFILILLAICMVFWLSKIQYTIHAIHKIVPSYSVVRFPIEQFPINDTESETRPSALLRVVEYPEISNRIFIVVSPKNMEKVYTQDDFVIARLEINFRSNQLLNDAITNMYQHQYTEFWMQCENAIYDTPSKKRIVNYIIENEGYSVKKPCGEAVQIPVPLSTRYVFVEYRTRMSDEQDKFIITTSY